MTPWRAAVWWKFFVFRFLIKISQNIIFSGIQQTSYMNAKTMTTMKHKWRCEQARHIQSLSSHRRREENEEFLDIEIVFAEFYLNIIINKAR